MTGDTFSNNTQNGSGFSIVDISGEVSSANKSNRSNGQIDMLVFHSTECGLDAARRELTVGDRRVSAHYLIARDGTVYRLVPEEERAHHAGESRWVTVDGSEMPNINDRSIGIEFEAQSGQGFTAAQIQAGLKLSKQITQKYGIDPHNVVGHADITPDGRKHDPDASFPWELFQAAGIAENGARRGGAGKPVAMNSDEYAYLDQMAKRLKENRLATEGEMANVAAENIQKQVQEQETKGNMMTGIGQMGMQFASGNAKLAFFGIWMLGQLAETKDALATQEKAPDVPNQSGGVSGVLAGAGSTIGDIVEERANALSGTLNAFKGMV